MLPISFVMSLVLLFTPADQNAVDFSGTWKMDPARSESAHQAVPIEPVTLVLKQTATELTIETRRGESNKTAPQAEILTYKLDGSETNNPGPDSAPIKCRAHWEGSKLITETTRNIQEATVTTMYIHSLDPSRNELTIRKTLTVQHGYQFEGAKNSGTGTDVFIRMKTATAK